LESEYEEKKIKLKISFNRMEDKLYVIPEYWDDEVKEFLESAFPKGKINHNEETEYVGRKRSFCG